jgi:hypothetical protein
MRTVFLSVFATVALLMGAPASFAKTAPPSYRTVVLSDRPIAYYRLDERTSRIAHDSSGHHLDGAIGAHVKLGQPGLIADAAASMEFSGADKSVAAEGVRIPGNPLFAQATNVSIEAWAFPYSFGVYGKNNGDITIAAYGRDDHPDKQHCRYALELDAHSHVLHFPVAIKGKVTDPVHVTGLRSFASWMAAPFAPDKLNSHELYAAPGSDGNPPMPHTRYYMVGTYDGTTMRFYINGQLNNVMHVRGSITGYGARDGMGIGGEFIDVNPVFRGRINEVAVYAHVLTPEQILRHYEAGIGAAPIASRHIPRPRE